MRLIVGTIVVSAGLIAVCGLSAQEPGAVVGNGGKGRDLFIEYGCSQCHGTAAQGSLSAPPLVRGMTYGLVLAKVRTKSGRMPRYSSEILPDEKVSEIAAYLTALPPAPDPRDIPALSD